jgi:hypothetical protein
MCDNYFTRLETTLLILDIVIISSSTIQQRKQAKEYDFSGLAVSQGGVCVL